VSGPSLLARSVSDLDTAGNAENDLDKAGNAENEKRYYSVTLLTHMTFTTKVGMSFIVDMNDDMPQVDNFSCGCYQALLYSEKRTWD